ncbi:uncharacterized protein METZ01_LOCUS263164, partial [marine metagenome]
VVFLSDPLNESTISSLEFLISYAHPPGPGLGIQDPSV